MDKITLDQLRQTFSDRHSGWRVSLFMPAHREGRETRQDPIRFRNLLRPLLPLLTSDGTFHIFAISQNQLQLLEETRHTGDEIDLENVPETLSELFSDGFPEKSSTFIRVRHRGPGTAQHPYLIEQDGLSG
ncbi:MAG: hypothetical protein K0B01_12875 [Syntrophobacterales bacterium]|nr:hypothetical protein [Syntrophobacterales bacterium]